MRGTTGIRFTRKVTRLAKGVSEGQRRKMSIGFSAEEFDRIQSLASANGISFGEQVRRMCLPDDAAYSWRDAHADASAAASLAVSRHAEAEARSEAAEARLAEALAALEPFAKAAEYVSREHPGWDHDGFQVKWFGEYLLDLAPFRRARVLTPKENTP